MSLPISPEWSLIHSIIQAGPAGLHYALGRGLIPEHISPLPGKRPNQKVLSAPGKTFEFFLNYISADRIPTPHEIKLAMDIDVPPYEGDLDVKLCTEVVMKGALRSQLLEDLGKNQDTLVSDPLIFREKLYDMYQGTGWIKGNTVDSTNNPDSILEVLDAYKETKALRGKGIIGLSSPWPSFDARTRGLQKGHLNILVAKRAVGKSQLSLVWLNHIWQNDLKPTDKIIFVSMEMDRLMVKRRLFSICAGLDYGKFNEGHLTRAEEQNFYDFCDDLMNPPAAGLPEIIFLYSDQINSVRDIEVKAAEYNPALIIVDGLYIIGRGSTKARWERTIDTVEELKLRLALLYPVIAIHQLKGTTKENTMIADADELAYAKAIADYADAIYGVFADDAHKRGRQRTIRTLKGRDFLPIHWRINFDMENQDYSEIDVIPDDEPPVLAEDDKPSGKGGYEASGPAFGGGAEISI